MCKKSVNLKFLNCHYLLEKRRENQNSHQTFVANASGTCIAFDKIY